MTKLLLNNNKIKGNTNKKATRYIKYIFLSISNLNLNLFIHKMYAGIAGIINADMYLALNARPIIAPATAA